VVTRELPLPQVTSKTHMQQAEEFSQKLVAGFGLRDAVALEFSDWILEASARQRIQPELIASLVLAESSFRKQVQSHVGAVGPPKCGHAIGASFAARMTSLIQNRIFIAVRKCWVCC
jgi:hypothetical protein